MLYYANKSVEKIKASNPKLADKINAQHTYLTEEDIKEVEKIDRNMLVLVRCGNGRFLCPVQDVNHFIGIIEEHSKIKNHDLAGTDWIRDVSFPAN